jgi:short subunit dehydrogenase-like uncharacterized protein
LDKILEKWMIYGAYGFTGRLVVEEAIKRGHKPILAGRSERKLEHLAGKCGLEHRAFDLESPSQLVASLQDVDLVFHAAGPFQFTSAPMIQACLESRTNYIDITGEIPVFQNTFARHSDALEAGIALISGAGMDVVPTDCMAKYVFEKLPGAVELELALATTSRPSAGTVKSSLEMMPRGGLRRQSGKLVPHPLGSSIKKVSFPHRDLQVLSISWGDLETAYRSTAIPDITTYMAYPPRFVSLVRRFGPLAQKLASVKVVRGLAHQLASRMFKGPDDEMRRNGRSYVWASVKDRYGEQVEAWLVTLEAYQLTAVAGVRSVEKLLMERPLGSLTPAQAFGADFILEIEGTQRYDDLPRHRKSPKN